MKKIFTSETPEHHAELVRLLPSYVQKVIKEAFGENVTETTLQNEPAEGNEDILEAFGDTLPEELLQRKIKECISEKKSLLDSLDGVFTLIEKRKNTWEVDAEEPYKEELLATINLLSGARFDESLFLGRGNAGHVFTAPGAEGYCIKYLHNPSKQSSSIDEEFTLLGQVNEISQSFQLLKTPQAHALAKNIEGTKNFFTMEQIGGLTLAQLVSFPSKRESEYPGKTAEDIISILGDKITRAKLLADLGKLHDAGVIHGDIHERNIMLSPDGSIYLIDFGNAVIPVNISVHAPYENIENVKELDFKAFNNTFDIIIAQIKKQLTK